MEPWVTTRKGKHVCEWYEPVPVSEKYPRGLRRRVETFATMRAAKDKLTSLKKEQRQRTPREDPDVTWADYAPRKLESIRPTIRPRTFECYADMLRLHVLPRFGRYAVRETSRGAVKEFLADMLKTPITRAHPLTGKLKVIRPAYSSDSVRLMLATMSLVCEAAVEDGLIIANPLQRLRKSLHLVRSPKARHNAVKKKAMTEDQARTFLHKCRAILPWAYPIFLLIRLGGLRIGEVLALWWEDPTDPTAGGDIDFKRGVVHVRRSLDDDGDTIGPPKSEDGVRAVRQSPHARALLVQLARLHESAKQSHACVPPWLFPAANAMELPPGASYVGPEVRMGSVTVRKVHGVIDPHNLRRAFKKVLRALNTDPANPFPQHFSPRSLRHTMLSLLMSKTKDPDYVRRQAGHEDLSTTDVYAGWFDKDVPGGNDCVDDPKLWEEHGNSKRVVTVVTSLRTKRA